MCPDTRLTDGHTILLPQVVTDVAGTVLILHHHLVAAFAAVDQPVQERFARARDAPGFVAIILGIVVLEHGLNLDKGLPADVGWVHIVDADTPLLQGEACDRGAYLGSLVA